MEKEEFGIVLDISQSSDRMRAKKMPCSQGKKQTIPLISEAFPNSTEKEITGKTYVALVQRQRNNGLLKAIM